MSAPTSGGVCPGQKWVRKFGPTAPVRVSIVTDYRVHFTDNNLTDHSMTRSKFLASYERVRGGGS